jgi:hypothetical protein
MPVANTGRVEIAQQGAHRPLGAALHPNELDRRRITRALAQRARYRYVSPHVEIESDSYRIVSPCCSRTIDAQGGQIDIAKLEFDERRGLWRLHARNHDERCWEPRAEGKLHEMLTLLKQDPKREFWR